MVEPKGWPNKGKRDPKSALTLTSPYSSDFRSRQTFLFATRSSARV